jgi:GAF domain-containing protein
MSGAGDDHRVATRLRVLSESALSAESVEDVVDAFLLADRALLNVDQVHLIEVSQDAAVGHARVVAYEAGVTREDAYVMVLDERPSGTHHVVSTGEVLHVPDAPASDALRQDFTERFGVRSALFVPLKWSGVVRWVAVLVRVHDGPYSDDAIDLARVTADLAAAGLALLEARDSQESHSDRDAALARAAAVLNAGLPLQTVLDALCREADLALEGDMSGIYLGDSEHGGIATAGHNSPKGWLGYLMQPGEGVGGQVLRTGRAAISNAYQSDVRIPDNPGLQDLQTAVAVPVAYDGAVLGALSIGYVRMRRVSPADLRTLEAFADLVAVALRITATAGAGASDPPGDPSTGTAAGADAA